MRRRVRTWGLATLLPAAVFACWPGSSAAAGASFIACPNAAAFECASVPVPLERTGAVPGTISLSVERKQAGAAPSRDAVVALAGGPGQAALPLGEFIAQAIAPALSSRDLLVFDQRGTGASDPLSCPALEAFSSDRRAICSNSARRRSAPREARSPREESVQDIEALRQAGGYEKLVLYGTSYGTKVALEYAERYPQHVEALVLDSVVPPEGAEPFAIPTFQAIGGVLDEICANGACAGISSDPLGRPRAHSRRSCASRPLSGSVYDGSGKRHSSTLDATGLLDVLEAGDLNPALRALLPAAVRSALRARSRPAAAPAPALRGPDPQRAARTRQRRKLAEASTKRCSRRPVARRARSRGSARAAPRNAPERSTRLPARAADQRLLPVRRQHGATPTASFRTAPAGPTPRRRRPRLGRCRTCLP